MKKKLWRKPKASYSSPKESFNGTKELIGYCIAIVSILVTVCIGLLTIAIIDRLNEKSYDQTEKFQSKTENSIGELPSTSKPDLYSIPLSSYNGLGGGEPIFHVEVGVIHSMYNGTNTSFGIKYNENDLVCTINTASYIYHHLSPNKGDVIELTVEEIQKSFSTLVKVVGFFRDVNNKERAILISPRAAQSVHVNPKNGLVKGLIVRIAFSPKPKNG